MNQSGFFAPLAADEIDLFSGDLWVMLINVNLVVRHPALSLKRRSELAEFEITNSSYCGGYVAGGRRVDVTARKPAGGDLEITIGGALWPRSTIAATGAVYYLGGGQPDQDRLYLYNDFDETVVATGGDWCLRDLVIDFKR